MTDRLKLRTALVTLAVASACLMRCNLWAQSSGVISLSVGDFGSYGYRTPYTEIGAGIEHRSQRTMFEGALAFSPTHKNTVNDGYSLTGRASGYLRVRSLFAGGGISQTRVSNSAWSKTATRPFLTLGFDNNRVRLAIERSLPGNDPNNVQTWIATSRLTVSRHVRVGASLYVSTFEQRLRGETFGARGLVVQVGYIMGAAQ